MRVRASRQNTVTAGGGEPAAKNNNRDGLLHKHGVNIIPVPGRPGPTRYNQGTHTVGPAAPIALPPTTHSPRAMGSKLPVTQDRGI